MSVELHLPDLPEVPISVGSPDKLRPRVAMPWHLRLRDTLSSYLPLLLMALLALATIWLVRNSPRPVVAEQARAVSSEPDYTMEEFALERFDPAGKLKLRIEGAKMRHYPATDHIEIEGAVIRVIAPDGRVTLAHARRAVGAGDGSELQLIGGAEVSSERQGAEPLVMRSEYLHADFITEKVNTNKRVEVQMGATEMQAEDGLDYDHAAQRLELKGRVRAVLAPAASASAPAR